MPNVPAIIGYNRLLPTPVNKLLAVFGNDVVDVDTNTGFGLNLSTVTDASLKVMLDSVFLQNYSTIPKTYNGTIWSKKHVNNAPIAKGQMPFKLRMYVWYTSFNYGAADQLTDQDGNVLVYPSRVFYTDLPTASSSASVSDSITWGLEWGTNGKFNADSDVFSITSPLGRQNFLTNNVKVGDPLFITKSSDASHVGRYTILEIKNAFQVRLDRKIVTSGSSIHFWAGSNWYDVGGEENDYLMAAAENDNALLNIKQFSIWRYNLTSLQRIKDYPGTTSKDSVVTIGDLTFYFHGSNTDTRKTGIWMYSRGDCALITRALQPYIDGIPAANYDNIVAWREGSKLRMYVGDITNVDRNISITNAVINYDTEGGQLDVGPIADQIISATRFVESNSEKFFIGTADSQVMQTPTGSSHNTAPIAWSMETGPKYPASTGVINCFPRIQIVSRAARGIQVMYKLLGMPAGSMNNGGLELDDDQYKALGDIQSNHEEFVIPNKHCIGRGIDIRLQDSDGFTANFVIEKISIFHYPIDIRSTS
jgi:hypothetical protein